MIENIIDMLGRKTLKRLCRLYNLPYYKRTHSDTLRNQLVSFYNDNLNALLQNLYKYEIADICDWPYLEQYPRDEVRTIALQFFQGKLDKNTWMKDHGYFYEENEIQDDVELQNDDDVELQNDDDDDDDDDELQSDDDDDEQEEVIRYKLPLEFDQTVAVQKPYPFQQDIINTLHQRTQTNNIGEKLCVRVATGGGKTRIANDWLSSKIVDNKRVLWITMRWELLDQAASDLCRRYPDVKNKIGRVGGQHHLPQLSEIRNNTQLVYTTIHTWNARLRKIFRRKQFDYVIIDEVHWGEGRPMFNNLMRHYENQAVFIGLTATPHKNSIFQNICSNFDFHSLVAMNYLAKPIPDPKTTGVQWNPQRFGQEGDIRSDSLNELSMNSKRNQFIVDTYKQNIELYGKTLIFACNINHAVTLTNLFQKQGFSAEVLHSGMPIVDRQRVINNFRTGTNAGYARTNILINVSIMIYGIDIPDIETIFMARPTASSVLFSQSIGRACRRTPTKSSFRIVDFVDNLTTHGDWIIKSIDYPEFIPFVDELTPSPSPKPPPPKKHSYNFADILSYPGYPPYQILGALEFQPNQTFGIEFELTSKDFDNIIENGFDNNPDWQIKALKLLQELKNADLPVADKPLITKDPDKNFQLWNVEPDRSCGWEITSPILLGEDGFTEIAKGCRVINNCLGSLKLLVNENTATHIHLGWENYDLTKLQNLMKFSAYYEPALLSLVAPSRYDNDYCISVRKIINKLMSFHSQDRWSEYFSNYENRYFAVNLYNLFSSDGLGTVEIRLHSGTVEELKILAWISLWMRIMNAIDRGVTPPILPKWDDLTSLPLTTKPEGDIEDLAKKVNARAEIVKYFKKRREYVISNSYAANEDYEQYVISVSGKWGIELPDYIQ